MSSVQTTSGFGGSRIERWLQTKPGTTDGGQRVKVMADSLDPINSFDANLEEIILVGCMLLFGGFS